MALHPDFPKDTARACANRIFVFIDAANLWQAQKSKGKFLDYQKTEKYLCTKFCGTSIKCFFYTSYPADGTRTYNLDGKHKFFTFLKKGFGFGVRKKELKRITVTSEGGEAIQEKGNMDVEITVDAMHHLQQYDTAIFFTGDSDFLFLMTYLRNRGKKVYIFSSKNNVSHELRTGGDGYVDILEVDQDIWGRDLKHRSSIQQTKTTLRKEGGPGM